VSFDPNARLDLWPTTDAFVDAALAMLPACHLVKLSEEELDLLGGAPATPAEFVLRQGPKAVLITCGAGGARLFTPDAAITVPGLPVVVVDTTGAGDAFVGAFLFDMARRRVTPATLEATLRDEPAMRACLAFANACAAASVTRRGAIPAMPAYADVEALMDRVRPTAPQP
jgi:fructokinase